MTPSPERQKAALDRVAERFYRDLGSAAPARGRGATIYFRDDHPPRFPAPADVEVVEVGGGGGSEEPFAETVALGLGLPASSAHAFARLPGFEGWRCYLGLADGNPAAAGAMLVDGHIAQLGLAATLESARGTRSQLALLHRQIEDAISLGVDLLVADVEAGDDADLLAARKDLRDAGFKRL